MGGLWQEEVTFADRAEAAATIAASEAAIAAGLRSRSTSMRTCAEALDAKLEQFQVWKAETRRPPHWQPEACRARVRKDALSGRMTEDSQSWLSTPAAEIARALDAVAVPADRTGARPGPGWTGATAVPDRRKADPPGRDRMADEPGDPGPGRSEEAKVIGLPFLAQFDFAEIPDPSDQLPRSGMLFVFADIDNHTGWDDEDTTGKAHRVIYVPDVAATPPMREPPDTVVPVDDSQGVGRFYDPWATHDASKPRNYAAWSLEARVVETYPEPSRNDETLAAWEAMQARFAAHGTADPAFAEVWTISAIETAYDSERTRRMTAQGLEVNGWRRDPGDVRGLWAIATSGRSTVCHGRMRPPSSTPSSRPSMPP